MFCVIQHCVRYRTTWLRSISNSLDFQIYTEDSLSLALLSEWEVLVLVLCLMLANHMLWKTIIPHWFSPDRSSSDVDAMLARLQTSLRAASTNLWALSCSCPIFTFRSLQHGNAAHTQSHTKHRVNSHEPSSNLLTENEAKIIHHELV